MSNGVIIAALPDKMTFRSRSDRIAGRRHAFWEKSLLESWTSKCKIPQMRPCLSHFRRSM